jgi:hypothetical protein
MFGVGVASEATGVLGTRESMTRASGASPAGGAAAESICAVAASP